MSLPFITFLLIRSIRTARCLHNDKNRIPFANAFILAFVTHKHTGSRSPQSSLCFSPNIPPFIAPFISFSCEKTFVYQFSGATSLCIRLCAYLSLNHSLSLQNLHEFVYKPLSVSHLLMVLRVSKG
ncbi:hypothetical protein BJV82DRAFT_219958 [Fennellomyces sp. T-0311]|nr:hypothetical protein BJV82DRAFT_219958 [Fennellomyces sp. T-0311]